MGHQIEQSILAETQNIQFNTSYINQQEFDSLHQHIAARYGDKKEIVIVDFGGGNGEFCDAILKAYENAFVYNIDLSNELLKLNEENPRKRLVHGSFLDFKLNREADIVCLNYVLHHLVSSSVSKSRDLIAEAFKHASSALSKNGSLVIFENILDGYFDAKLSSALLYLGTSSKLLAGLTGMLGANTAGVGVYYMGEDELVNIGNANGFKLEYKFGHRQPRKSYKLWPVFAKEIRREGFVFTKK